MADLQRAPIPFGNLQASGLEQLGGASPAAMNVITEPLTNAIRRRPGLSTFTDAIVNSSGDEVPILGVYETVNGDVFVVGDSGATRRIYRVTSGGNVDLSSGTDSDVRGTLTPIFAETEALLVISGGREPQKLELDSLASSRLAGGPPDASHIVADHERLVGNEVVSDLKGHIRYSNTASGATFTGNETWSSGTASVSGIFNTSKPDPVLALATNNGQIFSFGRDTLDIFIADQNSIYVPAASEELGCGAPYSIVKVNENFAWLDQYRRIVLSNGRDVEVLSDPIQSSIQSMATVTDCYGYRIVIGPLDLMVWTFPTEQRTFCFQKGSGWAEWAFVGLSASEKWSPFPVTAAFARRNGTTIAGTSDGRIGTFGLIANDFESAINADVTTGFQDRDTDARKQCLKVRIALRPLSQVDIDAPVGFLSWRDDLGVWNPGLPVAFGRDPVVQFDSLGVYRRRQWRFEFTGSSDFALLGVTEDFTVLEN